MSEHTTDVVLFLACFYGGAFLLVASLYLVMRAKAYVWWTILLFVGVAVGAFGAANWNDHAYPILAVHDEKSREYYWNRHREQVAAMGKNAVIPKVYCLPLMLLGAVMGLTGAVQAARTWGED